MSVRLTNKNVIHNHWHSHIRAIAVEPLSKKTPLIMMKIVKTSFFRLTMQAGRQDLGFAGGLKT